MQIAGQGFKGEDSVLLLEKLEWKHGAGTSSSRKT